MPGGGRGKHSGLQLCGRKNAGVVSLSNVLVHIVCGPGSTWLLSLQVKAATGEEVSAEDLGGADLHCR